MTANRNAYTMQHAVWIPPITRTRLLVPAGVDAKRLCRQLNRMTLQHHLPKRLRTP